MLAAYTLKAHPVTVEIEGIRIMALIGEILRDESGVGAIEYALVASLIAIAAVSGYTSLGSQVESSYTDIDQNLASTVHVEEGE